MGFNAWRISRLLTWNTELAMDSKITLDWSVVETFKFLYCSTSICF